MGQARITLVAESVIYSTKNSVNVIHPTNSAETSSRDRALEVQEGHVDAGAGGDELREQWFVALDHDLHVIEVGQRVGAHAGEQRAGQRRAGDAEREGAGEGRDEAGEAEAEVLRICRVAQAFSVFTKRRGFQIS